MKGDFRGRDVSEHAQHGAMVKFQVHSDWTSATKKLAIAMFFHHAVTQAKGLFPQENIKNLLQVFQLPRA